MKGKKENTGLFKHAQIASERRNVDYCQIDVASSFNSMQQKGRPFQMQNLWNEQLTFLAAHLCNLCKANSDFPNNVTPQRWRGSD